MEARFTGRPGAEAERALVAWQLGRAPQEGTAVAVRCLYGWPAVVQTPPRLAGGEPNPTLLYLTCPVLVKAISRVEAGGGLGRLRTQVAKDSGLRGWLAVLTNAYRRRRAEAGPDPRPQAGIGGPESPEVASCLHAYAAALLAVMTGWLRGPELSEEVGRALWASLFSAEGPQWCADDRCGVWLRQRESSETVGRDGGTPSPMPGPGAER